MAKKATKKKAAPARPQLGDNVEILSAGEVIESPITDTLETNYMPYAMSVIVSRALPEIDGFKPAHRKLLYTMYGMGLLKGARTKSANIVGSTMHLNPHGDAAIYDTMVRMGRGNESLLVPFVDSKGNFGKAYSRDMSCAAARYTEAKLEGVCEELFRDIDKETVDFVPNYDSKPQPPRRPSLSRPTPKRTHGKTPGCKRRSSGFSPRQSARNWTTSATTMATISGADRPRPIVLASLKPPYTPRGGALVPPGTYALSAPRASRTRHKGLPQNSEFKAR